MNRLRAYVIGLVFGVAGFASAAAIPYFTGAQDPSQLQASLNTLIGELNAQLLGFMTFNNGTEAGELQVTGSSTAFAGNGGVATTMTSLGPVGSHTTVQEWLVVVDTYGNIRYVPCY